MIERIKREIAEPRFLVDLTTWADRQCGRQLSIEGRCEPDKASDLVNSALVATLDGVRRWDPAARSLRRHCELTINSYLNRAFRAVLTRFYRLRDEIPDELRRNALETIVRDGGPPVATVARSKGRVVEIVPDDVATNDLANESGCSFDALVVSTDSTNRDDGESGCDRNAA